MAQAGLPAATLDAELLLAHCLGRNRTALLTHQESVIPQAIATQFRAVLERRCRREPVAYLTGRRAFYGRDFFVDRNVLIPRPESELLIETFLDMFERSESMTIADIGTGSGCLGVTLALEFPHANVIATDISDKALGVARKNAAQHSVEDRVTFAYGDLLAPLAGRRIDAIVANLPYVMNEELAANPDLAYEPIIALRGAQTSATTYRRFLTQWHASAQRPLVLMEIHPNLRLALEPETGTDVTVTFFQDLAGHDRVAVLQPNKTQA